MPRKSEDRESFNDYYQGILGGRAFRWLDRMKIRIVRSHLAGLPPQARILDLGCGSAGISSRLAGLFPDLHFTGVDHDESLLEMARGRGLNDVRKVDFDQPLPYDGGHFDVVLMFDTIEHVEHRDEVVTEVGRVLAADGKLIVFTPPYDSISWLLGERFHNTITRRKSDHISPFTRESLTWLLSRHFAEVSVGRTNFGLSMFGVGRQKRRPRQDPAGASSDSAAPTATGAECAAGLRQEPVSGTGGCGDSCGSESSRT